MSRSEFIEDIEPSPAGNGWHTAVWSDEVLHWHNGGPPLNIVEFPFVEGFFICTRGYAEREQGVSVVLRGPYFSLQAAVAVFRLGACSTF